MSERAAFQVDKPSGLFGGGIFAKALLGPLIQLIDF